MSSPKRLKKSKAGVYYVEIDSSTVEELEAELGDLLSIATQELWMYDKKTKVCTLTVVDTECYSTLIKNLASNRGNE